MERILWWRFVRINFCNRSRDICFGVENFVSELCFYEELKFHDAYLLEMNIIYRDNNNND